VPDISFAAIAAPNESRPWHFCAVGFFRPDKGIEETLHALAILKNAGVAFRFVMAGSPQPQFAGQVAYVERLEALAMQLGLGNTVRLRRAFLSREQQLALIRASHAGVFAYQDPDQSSSGTVPLVLASGRPVVCTPFEYAKAKRQELGEAVTVADAFDARAVAEALFGFIVARTRYDRITSDIHRATRPWLWSTVGKTYAAAFAKPLMRL
jgi:glycosyltransferase involved in cell wall biosynthesis